MWRPLNDVRREQEKRLRELLAVAIKAPYWKQVMDRLGKQPESFALSDLPSLPFLTKDILRERERDLCVQGAQGVYANFSGGSTGIPIRFYQDQLIPMVIGR